jgi:5-hydroxyisourate hydrolase-like protein (transthyretin family)
MRGSRCVRTGLLVLVICCAVAALVVGAAPARAGSISLHVQDAASGAPIAGIIHVEVGRHHSAGWSLVRFNSTSATGDVQFLNLPAGTYTLLLEDSTDRYPRCFWPLSFTRATATRIVLDDDTDYAGVADMTLAGHIGGVVRDDEGNPLGGISIGAVHEGQGGSGKTAADGTFDVGGLLPASDYIMCFEDTENEDYIYQWWPDQRFSEDAKHVSVSTGDTTPIEVTMHKSAHFTGVITTRFGVPARNVAVSAFKRTADGWENWSGECCHTDGTFRIFHLPPGEYRVAFWDTDRYEHKRWYPDTALPSEAKVFTLGPGETMELRDTVWNDTQRPTPSAPDAEVVEQGETADVRMCVRDPRPFGPRADVTIKVRTGKGKLVKTVVLPRRAVNRWLHGRFIADLPRGVYRFSVYVRDSGGNRETRPAVNTLRVR